MPIDSAQKVAAVISDAGGEIVGRTRLQKIVYLLSIAGLEEGFSFSYRHYGPYSEILAMAARDANLLGLVSETECQTNWGGAYSIYTATRRSEPPIPNARRILASKAAAANAVELELAATAVFLAKEGCNEPWTETARRKPEKAENNRIDRAKILYRELCAISTPAGWPDIV